MKTNQRRYELIDEEWAKIEPFFPVREDSTLGRPYNDIRTTVNGIIWIARSGAPWRDLPERYGKWNSVYKCFAKLAMPAEIVSLKDNPSILHILFVL